MKRSEFLKTLERKYDGAVVGDDWKCPHKGTDLRGCGDAISGRITCPLHGLQFDLVTKKQVNAKS